MKKQIFIINGSGGVGKDTFVEKIRTIVYFDYDDCSIMNYSSVAKIKTIAQFIGWNGEKTERDRKFLSDLKLLTTEYNDMPMNDMKKTADNFFKDSDIDYYTTKILFLHIREPEEIAKAVKEFERVGYDVKTILVKRNSVKQIISNMADENVCNYKYDIVVDNSGDIFDLRKIANNFIKDFMSDDLKKEY